jgi:WD40 repeat protein
MNYVSNFSVVRLKAENKNSKMVRLAIAIPSGNAPGKSRTIVLRDPEDTDDEYNNRITEYEQSEVFSQDEEWRMDVYATIVLPVPAVINRMCFSHDDSELMICCDIGVLIASTITGKFITQLSDFLNVQFGSFIANGRIVFLSHGYRLILHDLKNIIWEIGLWGALSIHVSHDLTMVACLTTSYVSIRSTVTGSVTRIVYLESCASTCSFSVDSLELFVVSNDQDYSRLHVYSIESCQHLRTFILSTERVKELSVSPDGLTIAYAPVSLGFRILDLSTGEIIDDSLRNTENEGEDDLSNISYQMIYSPDGSCLFMNTYGIIVVYDVARRIIVERMDGGRFQFAVENSNTVLL